MISSNSSIDWTKIMTETNKDEFVKTAEFREWLMGLLSDDKPTTITFTKKDGTDRVMKCTRNLSNIPEDLHPKSVLVDPIEAKDSASIKAFDLDKKEWRSFIAENVKRIDYSFV